MLHIVNGDVVGDKLRKGKIRGDILVWREVYPAGPVFAEMDEPRNRLLRAEYLEKKLGIPADDYVANCRSQERALQSFRQYEEVVLWFEHDLFDQLMLSYLLDWFSKQALGRTKLNLLCIGDYPGIDLFRGLGQLSIQQLEALSGTWKRVGEQELETGSRIWQAYCSSEVDRHAALLREDTAALPFARSAIELHLSRLPSLTNGLGIVEQATLELLRHGADTPFELFRQIGSRLIGLGMGDTEYWHRLRVMAEQPNALIEMANEKVRITETGTEAASGLKDWTKLRARDEWYGGLRLHGRLTWRWDPESMQAVHLK